MRKTALGYIVCVHPCFHDMHAGDHEPLYECVVIDGNGHWSAGTHHETKGQACIRRTAIFKLHRKLAKERGEQP